MLTFNLELRPVEIYVGAKRLGANPLRWFPPGNIPESSAFGAVLIVFEKQSQQPNQREHCKDYYGEEDNNCRLYDALLIFSEREVRSSGFNLSPLS